MRGAVLQVINYRIKSM